MDNILGGHNSYKRSIRLTSQTIHIKILFCNEYIRLTQTHGKDSLNIA